MASIYTAPGTGFIDSYVNAAKYLDQRGDERTKQIFQGAENLTKGGMEAYKWQVRKNIADEAEKLANKEKELQAELDRLRGEKGAQMSDTMSAIMNDTGWKGMPFPYSPGEDQFVAPRPGIGIMKKELL